MTFTLPQDGFNDIVTGRHGLFVFHRGDQYVGRSLRKYGEFSPGESQLFRQIIHSGGTIVEAGANFGAHTVELSRLVGRGGAVHAFEPQRLVFQALCANLALNSCANVFVHQAAVGAEPGHILVPAIPPEQGANFGGVTLAGVTAGERVPLITIDSLGLAQCHAMKIDVEGMEVEALRGASETIKAHRPLLYVENDREARSQELIALLLSWNYDLYWHLPPLYDAANFAADPQNIFPGIVSINVFGAPAERGLSVQGSTRITNPADRWTGSAPAPASAT